MGKSLADAMNAQPGPDSLAYWLAPFKGYFDRQGQMAQGGLDQAEQGAQDFRNNLSPMGLANMLMGPANYIASPITALLPTEAEAYAAPDLPEWSKPGMAGVLGTAMAVMPGPKFKGLGRGMSALADDATAAERAALGSRLEAEAAQTGGVPATASRDQALRGLTEAPQNAGMGHFDFGPGTSSGSREVKIGDTTVTYGVGRDGLVEVILIKTPKDKRGQGSARAAMETMKAEADAAGLRLGLNADPMDKGISKPKLEEFYKSLGFKRNAGNKRDFTTRLEYLREPKQ